MPATKITRRGFRAQGVPQSVLVRAEEILVGYVGYERILAQLRPTAYVGQEGASFTLSVNADDHFRLHQIAK